jgi:hypothetical protein
MHAWRKQCEETSFLCKGMSPRRHRAADDTADPTCEVRRKEKKTCFS